MGERALVSVRTLGCKVNQAESDAISAELAGLGIGVAGGADAQVVVVTTCTVTGEADHKARKAIRQALALPGSPMVVVTGCLAVIDPAGLAALGPRIVVEADKSAVAALVARHVGAAGHPPAPIARQRTRARAQVKVQDGCDTFCTYCIVPHARGVPRSIPSGRVLDEVRGLVAAGVTEVVLTGINIGRYRDGNTDLADLIEAVAATGVPRVRVSSVEPGDVSERLLASAARTGAFCRHLHIPLQSGCERTLQAMGRPYSTARYRSVVEAARRVLPGVAITTDVIAGFPGETESDAAESLSFVRAMGFARLHVFRYSVREGTRAALLPGQVPAPTKAERATAMRQLGAELVGEFTASAVGTTVEVLTERVASGDLQGHAMAEGTSREYLRVRFPAGDAAPETLQRVVIAAAAGDGWAVGERAE